MKNYLSLFFLSILFSSCIGSLYPISKNESEFIIRKELFGTWKEGDSNSEYIIGNTGSVYYRITVIDKDGIPGAAKSISSYDTSRFSAFLVKKNNIYFLDCFVDVENDIKNSRAVGRNAAATLLPMHMIFKIQSIKDNELRFSTLDPDLFKSQSAKKLVSIKHEILSNDEILLTEQPGKLQQKLSSTKAVFGEISIFKRVK